MPVDATQTELHARPCWQLVHRQFRIQGRQTSSNRTLEGRIQALALPGPLLDVPFAHYATIVG